MDRASVGGVARSTMRTASAPPAAEPVRAAAEAVWPDSRAAVSPRADASRLSWLCRAVSPRRRSDSARASASWTCSAAASSAWDTAVASYWSRAASRS